MAKRAKRREWTKDDVRELKILARQKTPVAKIAKFIQTDTWRNSTEGVYARRVIGFARLT